MTDGQDALMGGGQKAVSFAGAPPVTWSGTVLEIGDPTQRKDIDDGTPLTWRDGNPKLQVVVKLQTDVRDPDVEDDEGVRGLYLDLPSARQRAVKKAVTDAGAKRLEVGGRLSVTYTHDDVKAQTNRAFNPPKSYEAKYEPPDPLSGGPSPWDVAAVQAPAVPSASVSSGEDSVSKFLADNGIDGVSWTPARRLLVAQAMGYQA